jgi:uncharacterized protein (DUF1697 family)
MAMPRSKASGGPRRWVALLRAINVGGHSVVKMADVRKVFESLGLTDVATYIQTGNVIFSTHETDPRRLARQLEEKLTQAIGKVVQVFVLSPAELAEAAAHNPFEPERRDQEQRCHLMFMSAVPAADRGEKLMAMQGEEYRFHLRDKVLYYAYDNRYALGNRRTIDFEKVLGVAGTARSWKVIAKLIELAGA